MFTAVTSCLLQAFSPSAVCVYTPVWLSDISSMFFFYLNSIMWDSGSGRSSQREVTGCDWGATNSPGIRSFKKSRKSFFLAMQVPLSRRWTVSQCQKKESFLLNVDPVALFSSDLSLQLQCWLLPRQLSVPPVHLHLSCPCQGLVIASSHQHHWWTIF